MSFNNLGITQSVRSSSYRAIVPAAPIINLTADRHRQRFSLRNENRTSQGKAFENAPLRATKISTPFSSLEAASNKSNTQYAEATEKYQAAQSMAYVYGLEPRAV